MCLTFQMMTLEKYLTKNFEIFFRGYPIFAPKSAMTPKMTTSALPMTPPFYCRIRFFSEKVDVCKKLNKQYMLRFDGDMRGLSLKKKTLSKFSISSLCKQKHRKSASVQYLKKIPTWSVITFYSICR